MKKVLKNLKVSEWLKHGHMSNFFMGKGVYHIERQLYWKRMNLRILISFGFGHQ